MSLPYELVTKKYYMRLRNANHLEILPNIFFHVKGSHFGCWIIPQSHPCTGGSLCQAAALGPLAGSNACGMTAFEAEAAERAPVEATSSIVGIATGNIDR